MNELISKDENYKNWINEVSSRFHASQIKAAIKVNEEMLRFYWSLGRDLEGLKDSYLWGENFYETVSKDLKKTLLDVKSFSSRNLRYMNSFYNFYPNALILPQVGAKFPGYGSL